MSRNERPDPIWLWGLIAGILIKGTLVVAAEMTMSEPLVRLLFMDPSSDLQGAVADWFSATFFEPCCFGCLRSQLVFDATLILGAGVECALAVWLIDVVLIRNERRWFVR